MKPRTRTIILFATMVLFALLVLRAGSPRSAWLESHLGELHRVQGLYREHPASALILFALSHFLCATFAVPGSCTSLNIGSGAVFGFWTGCMLVYPVTIASACFGYFAAGRLRETRLFHRYESRLASLETGLAKGGFLFLISLRLSPFLPYGVLNPALGLLRVPFGTFIASTTAGIFFDVVLLNSVGAAFAAAGGEPAVDTRKLLLGFLVLVGLAAALRHLARQMQKGESP